MNRGRVDGCIHVRVTISDGNNGRAAINETNSSGNRVPSRGGVAPAGGWRRRAVLPATLALSM